MNPASPFRTRGTVAHTPELERIRTLPRRDPGSDLEQLARDLTAVLRTPTGTMSLRPIQAQALVEIGLHGGLLGPIRVGGGKTLISLLAPYILDAKRPILILPAALIEKTEREREILSQHWRIPRNIRILSYEQLGRVQSANVLEFYRPDLVITDEAHKLKNPKAACTRRVARHMKEHPETRFVAISGTLMTHSVRDFGRLTRWALKGMAPVPATEGELEEWADALDEDRNMLQRVGAGALLSLCEPEDRADGANDTTAARRGFRRRFLSTPGVVATTADDGYTGSLYVRARRYDVNPVTETNFSTLRNRWETPDGWALSEAVAVWRHARELALGLHYVWSPRPPEAWLNARREWAAFVREILSHSRTLDTELQVRQAAKKGDLDATALHTWEETRPGYTPCPKPLWHDDSALRSCQEWLEEGPGIVWTEHTFFAEELSRITGVSYYGPNGLNSRGEPIEKADPKRSVIASVAANSTGRNLQAWNRNLITSCPSLARTWEQLLGRTHRDGQRADEVTADVLVGCAEHVDAFWRAMSGAMAARDTLGQTQKLLIADVDFPQDVPARTARWLKTPGKAPADDDADDADEVGIDE